MVKATQITLVNPTGKPSICAHYYVPTPTQGGCSVLSGGSSWTISTTSTWQGGTIWAVVASNCPSSCNALGPSSGVTQFEFTLNGGYSGMDNYDVSSAAGFNMPVLGSPSSSQCSPVSCGFATCPSVEATCSYGTNYVVYFSPS